MRYIIICMLLIAVDQASKWLVVKYMYGENINILNNLLSLTYVENRGAAWGILSQYDVILKFLPPLLIGIIVWYLYKNRHSIGIMLSGALIVGGAIGNYIDRVFRGFVVDFINLKVWPVFNFADMCIVCGCLVAIIILFRKED